MRARRTTAGLVATLLAAALASCGGASDEAGGPRPSAGAPAGLTVAVDELPRSLDPARASTPAARAVAGAVHTPLLTYRRRADSGAGTLVAGLARALPELSDDHRDYTFRLRPGLLYADGRLVRASDVERGIAHASRHAIDRGIREVLAGISGPATRDGESLRGVISDDRTGEITIRLREPDGRLPLVLADSATAPLPVLPGAARRSDPATGPLRIARQGDGRIELVANPLRAAIAEVPAAGVSRITLVAAEAPSAGAPDAEDALPGGADLWLDPPAGAQVEGGRTAGSDGAIITLFVRPDGALESRTPRRALAAAIDRRTIDEDSGGQLVAACGLLPPYVTGAVVRDPCPQAPSDPAGYPLDGVDVAIGVSAAEPATVRNTVGRALRRLGSSPRFRTLDDPAAAVGRGSVDMAIVRIDPRIAYPAAWLEPVTGLDRLIGRELPELAAGPLTGSAGEWERLERRAVDRGLAVPLAAGRTGLIAGAAIDRSGLLLHPILGLDLAALSRR